MAEWLDGAPTEPGSYWTDEGRGREGPYRTCNIHESDGKLIVERSFVDRPVDELNWWFQGPIKPPEPPPEPMPLPRRFKGTWQGRECTGAMTPEGNVVMSWRTLSGEIAHQAFPDIQNLVIREWID